MTPDEKEEARKKRIRRNEEAFQERTKQQFGAFQDCWGMVTERTKRKAAKLMKKDEGEYRWRPFESLVSNGVNVRMVTQICKHTEWLPEDCGRWLERLGMEPGDVQWILKEVSKRRLRAHWAKMGGLKPGTRL
jgi:hypothetical protein